MIELKGRKITLGSASPRRSELMKNLNVPFNVKTSNFDENSIKNTNPVDMAKCIAEGKNKNLRKSYPELDIIISADTIVYIDNTIFCKPKNIKEAKQMLQKLSNKYHKVVTAVCISDKKHIENLHSIARVKFAKLSNEDIEYYVNNYKPIDKAGAYGIQEWIGAIGIEKIDGDFYTIVGMPVQLVYKHLKYFINYE